MSQGVAWVDVLLARWGRWAIRCESGALGFASSCALGGLGGGDGYGSTLPLGVASDADLATVDVAVRKLPTVLRLVVVEVYQFGGSVRKVSSRMGVDEKSVRRYLVSAQQKIALDMDLDKPQNPPQSANGQICVQMHKPALPVLGGFFIA